MEKTSPKETLIHGQTFEQRLANYLHDVEWYGVDILTVRRLYPEGRPRR